MSKTRHSEIIVRSELWALKVILRINEGAASFAARERHFFLYIFLYYSVGYLNARKFNSIIIRIFAG